VAIIEVNILSGEGVRTRALLIASKYYLTWCKVITFSRR